MKDKHACKLCEHVSGYTLTPRWPSYNDLIHCRAVWVDEFNALTGEMESVCIEANARERNHDGECTYYKEISEAEKKWQNEYQERCMLTLTTINTNLTVWEKIKRLFIRK